MCQGECPGCLPIRAGTAVRRRASRRRREWSLPDPDYVPAPNAADSIEDIGPIERLEPTFQGVRDRCIARLEVTDASLTPANPASSSMRPTCVGV